MNKLAAVIVEPRFSINLIKIIEDHIKFLPSDTHIHVFSERRNKFLEKTFENCYFTQISPSFNLIQYNLMFCSEYFWDIFAGKYERVLIFQHDSEILRPGIEEFYDWDYIGAPWKFDPYVGNGGLSLRNPIVMKEITSKYPRHQFINEDVWICMHMKNYGIGKLAPVEVANRFSVETVFNLDTFGAHAIDQWLTDTECSKIRQQYFKDTL